MAIQIGARPTNQSQSKFFSPKPDTTYKLTLLCGINQIVSCDQYELWDAKPAVIWPDTGVGDPGRELHLRPQWRSFVPVLVDDATEPVVWAMKKKQHEALIEASEAAEEDIKGMIIQLKRTGSGLTTRYTVTATPRRAKAMPKTMISTEEIVKMLNERPADEVKNEIIQKLGMNWSDIVDMYAEKHAADMAKKAAENGGKKVDEGEVELL